MNLASPCGASWFPSCYISWECKLCLLSCVGKIAHFGTIISLWKCDMIFLKPKIESVLK